MCSWLTSAGGNWDIVEFKCYLIDGGAHTAKYQTIPNNFDMAFSHLSNH